MLFDDVVKKNGLVIDIGCGNGLFTRKIACDFSSITSIDINKIRVNNLLNYCCNNKVSNIHPVEMSAYEIEYPDYQFDLAIFYRSVDHIAEYRKALDEAYRVLKINGQIYINVADTRVMTQAIQTTDELRAYEDELFKILEIGEGICEIKPISIDGLLKELKDIGFNEINVNVLENDNSKVNEYYVNIQKNIQEMLGMIKGMDKSKYEENYARHKSIMEKIKKTGIGIRNNVEIVGEKE